jgi:hypothetical protein
MPGLSTAETAKSKNQLVSEVYNGIKKYTAVVNQRRIMNLGIASKHVERESKSEKC